MRLTCPNCGAQYEVPAEVIPAEGRDVQCSNCGDTWFQAHQDKLAEQPDVEDSPEPVEAEPAEERYSDPEPQQAEAETEEPQEDAPEQQQLDPAVADILRQEAEYEARLRATDGDSLESQGDLGLDNLPLDEAERRSREASERMARMRGQDPEIQAETGSRRGLLPDIEEINSTLRASGETAAPAAVAAAATVASPAKRGGFARGFILIVIVAILLVVLYVSAPGIMAAVPALEGALTSYVALVDQARVWLDGLMGGLVPE